MSKYHACRPFITVLSAIIEIIKLYPLQAPYMRDDGNGNDGSKNRSEDLVVSVVVSCDSLGTAAESAHLDHLQQLLPVHLHSFHGGFNLGPKEKVQ